MELVLLQGFLYPCDDIVHYVVMMNTYVFIGEIRRLSQLLVRCLEKLFELHPHLLYCRHAIPLVNRQPVLARPVDYYVGDVE